MKSLRQVESDNWWMAGGEWWMAGGGRWMRRVGERYIMDDLLVTIAECVEDV